MALSSFDFDPNGRYPQLVLTFDQTTTLTNADLANFTLQNAANNPTVSFALTGSTISSGEGAATQHTIRINFGTFKRITFQTTGLTNASNTFLSTTFPTAVTIPVTTYTTYGGTQPQAGQFYIIDFVYPNVVRITNRGSAVLNLDPTAITLSSSNTGTPSHTLTGGTVTYNVIYAYIQLTDADVEALNAISFNGEVLGEAYLTAPAGAWDEWYVPSPAQTNIGFAVFVNPTVNQYVLSTQLNMTASGISVAENEGVGTPNNRNIISFDADSYNAWFTTLSSLPAIANSRAVAYGNGTYLVTDLGALAATSPDGVTWTQQTIPSSGNWGGLAYGNGTFVVTSSYGTTAYTTPDGVTWTQRTLPIDDNFSFVVFGDGLFIALAGGLGNESLNYLTSPDGITWTQRTLPVAGTWSGVYANSQFVLVNGASSNVALTSPDGVTWTQRTLPATVLWGSVAFGNGVFVTLALYDANFDPTNIAATSPDGITWTQRTLPVTAGWGSIAFGDGAFVAPAASIGFNYDPTNIAVTSTDGITWTQQILPANANWGRITYGDSRFVTIGGGNAVVIQTPILDSTIINEVLDVRSIAILRNGAELAGDVLVTNQLLLEGPIGTPDNRNVISFGADSFVELDVVRETTNANFNDIWVVANVIGNPFGFGGPQFVAIGSASHAFYSREGVNWTQVTLPITINAQTLAYGSNPPRFVALDADNSDIYLTSDDGATWTQRTLPVVGDWYVLKYLNGSFYAPADNSSTLLVSADGITWTQRTLPTTASWRDIAFGNNVYLLSLFNSSSYYTSTDAITWTLQTFPVTAGWSAVAFGNGVFVAIANNAIYTSSDGIDWTYRPITTVFNNNPALSRVVFGGNVFLATGISPLNMLFSFDGITWNPPPAPIIPTPNFIAYHTNFAFSELRGRFTTISSANQQAISFFVATPNSTNINDAVQITGSAILNGDVTIVGELTPANGFNLIQLSNLRVDNQDFNIGSYVVPNGNNSLTYHTPNSWLSAPGIDIGDFFVGSAVGTTAAGDTTTTPPNVTDSGGGNPTAAPAGTYRCLGGIGVNQCLWVRTA